MAGAGSGWRDGHAHLTFDSDTGLPVRLPLEIARSYRARRKGLLRRTSLTGALLLTPANSIHTFGMRIPIDVAYLDRHLRVLSLHTMPPNRLGLPRLRARHVLEAEAGVMHSWGLRVGGVVRVEGSPT
ncbi:DUF192 domain-containing protein [Streptomyces sp. NPDC096205]|uniref:DUF192 domain-containing protein n=1 Tax=Streptomyces sp. NPDC096205 TaxID=3366081 RepID=UPI003828A496